MPETKSQILGPKMMLFPESMPSTTFLHRLADAADKETLPRFRTKLVVDDKIKPGYSYDPVTDADRQAELAIRHIIVQDYPDHAILGEEYGESGSGPFRWILDPIDGTLPFLCGIPVWGTLIGLLIEEHAALGMMSQPFTKERFWTDANGSWRSEAGHVFPMSVSGKRKLADAILHTNSPERFQGALKQGLDTLASLVRRVRYGGECYAFAMLAAGQIDICIEPNLQPYDIVALIPIIEKAGGIITRADGARAESGGPILAAANAELHEQVMHILKTTDM